MTHGERRCVHCGILYFHQTSGQGCGRPLNDGRYCPSCKAVVLEALQNVPSKVKKVSVLVKTRELFDKVLEHQKALDEAPDPVFDGKNPLSGLRWRFASFPLIDVETGRSPKLT